MYENYYDELDCVFVRLIGDKPALIELVEDLQDLLGIRLYPEAPKPEYNKPGLYRLYIKIPTRKKREQLKQEAPDDE